MSTQQKSILPMLLGLGLLGAASVAYVYSGGLERTLDVGYRGMESALFRDKRRKSEIQAVQQAVSSISAGAEGRSSDLVKAAEGRALKIRPYELQIQIPEFIEGVRKGTSSLVAPAKVAPVGAVLRITDIIPEGGYFGGDKINLFSDGSQEYESEFFDMPYNDGRAIENVCYNAGSEPPPSGGTRRSGA